MECYLCKDESDKSYFLRLKGFIGDLVEVCPECHHFFMYADDDLKQNYIKRRKIKI